MAHFSPKVRRLLLEYLTDVPLRQIDALFEDNNITLGPPQPDANDLGQRRERTRRYLVTCDPLNSADLDRLAGVLTDVLRTIEGLPTGPTFDADAFHRRWVMVLSEAGFEIDATTRVVRNPGRTGTVGFSASALAALVDPSVIHDHLARLGDTVETDPRLAVSTAKALIESTAKCVLTARSVAYTRADKIPSLVARAQESLGLAPKTAGDEQQAIRRMLQALVTLTQGVTEIRNQVGVDHGAESVPTWVRPRHARRVVGSAQVWCQLMMETLADPDAPWRAKGSGSNTS